MVFWKMKTKQERKKKLYRCLTCMALYEVKNRAIRCHYGEIQIYEVVKMKSIKDYWREIDE